MSVTVALKLENANQIRSAFAKSPMLISRNLNKAISIATLKVARRSIQNTPVDTGRLRSSTRAHIVNLGGQVSTNTSYDIFVHEGTRYMRARPFLADALEDSEDEINSLFTDAVQSTLDDIAREAS